MRSIELICMLEKCNLDGSENMTLDKCLKNGHPCYYLHVTEEKIQPNDVAWGRFKENLNRKP